MKKLVLKSIKLLVFSLNSIILFSQSQYIECGTEEMQSDLTGKFRYSGLAFKNSPICLKDLLGSGIYILQISSNGSSSICETKKLIIE